MKEPHTHDEKTVEILSHKYSHEDFIRMQQNAESISVTTEDMAKTEKDRIIIKMKKKDKNVITKRNLFGNSLSDLIGSAILFMLLLCCFIVLVGPFFDLPVWCKLTVGIIVLYLLLGMLAQLLAAANNMSKIKISEIVITDAKITEMYKTLSYDPEDFSYHYYVKLKCADKNVKKLEISSDLYNRVKVGSLCYNINVSDNVYPKNSYILGNDLLPYYKNEIE